MKKVLTERPRVRGTISYHQIRSRQKNIDFDCLPTYEGMRRPYGWETKEFSDLINPLIRFLWSCRGRKWDDVWSEICEQLSDNTVDSHLKDHVRMEVSNDVVLEDGKVFSLYKYYRGFREVDGLYVHPETGILCGAEKRRAKWKKDNNIVYNDGIAYDLGEDDVLRPTIRKYRDKDIPYSRKLIGFETEAVYVRGYWYWVVFDTVPPPSYRRNADHLPPLLINHICKDFVTGKEVREGRYRAGIRQMNRSDLRRHGLVNG
jgi:hypothetical protein